MAFWKTVRQKYSHQPVNLRGFWSCYSLLDMWQNNCCLGKEAGRVAVGAARPPVQSSRCSSSLAWLTSLFPPGAELLLSPLIPGPFRPKVEGDDQGEGWMDGEGGRRWLRVAGVSGIHSPPLPLQGLSLSSVWMGALSLGHNTMRGPGSAAVSAFHVSI